MQRYTVYILTNPARTVQYTGVTADLPRRLAEHGASGRETFVGRYNVRLLIYAEEHTCIRDALAREKRIKRWPRGWKLDLIQTMSPTFRHLSMDGTRPW